MCDRLLIHFMTDEHYMPRWMHTFHRLHKDLLFLTGVLFIHQHAVEDAAKCACQTQNMALFKEGAAEEEPEATHARIQMSPHSQAATLG